MNIGKYDGIDRLEFYRKQGIISNPGRFLDLYEELPDNIEGIIRVIQGLFLHVFWAGSYGVELDERQQEDVESRFIENILERIMEIDNSSLLESRPYKKRFFGNCRDHSVFLTSILRHIGIPARARCGFARYFTPGKFEDHWICEYYDVKKGRWVGVDPQLDELQKEKLNIGFDTTDLPEGEFLPGGKAWKLVRDGKEDAEKFGIFDMRGITFILGDLLRDLAALNKVELLPWDCWGLMMKSEGELLTEDYELLDQVVETIEKDSEEIFSIYNNKSLKVPNLVYSYIKGKEEKYKIFDVEK